MAAPIVTTLVGKLYGFSHIGLISGVITMVHHFGGGFWAFIGGWIFDQTGSYQLSFIKIAPENPVLWTGMKGVSAESRKKQTRC
jgi:nitrate/nitrite transporter NarK